jgi:hypothetical protein
MAEAPPPAAGDPSSSTTGLPESGNAEGQATAPSAGPAPATFPKAPVWLSALVICQEAYRDDRGRTHLHAVFENLNATGFPVQSQFMVWCSVRGRGTARLVIKIVDTLEQSLAVTEALIAEVTPFKAHEFFYGFNLQLPGAGLYRVQAFVDGIPAMEVPLMVRLTPPTQPPQPG